MPTINVRGTVIGYTDTGAPDGLPDAAAIVFGHGLLFSGWMFRPQIAALRDRYRCVSIDWRGQGDTPAAPGGFDMDSLTSDAVALIAELGLAPVHWVGLSMGGFVGQRLAARHGELLRSLTLLDTSAEAEEPGRARERRRLALFQLFFGMKPILGKVKPLLFSPAFLADPASDEVIGEWAARLGRSRRTALPSRGRHRMADQRGGSGPGIRAAPGTLTRFDPPGGPFVRVDTHARPGYAVPPHYDSLLAKVIAWAPDRDGAVARMRRALGELHAEGPAVTTTTAFLADLLDNPRFRAAEHDTAMVTALTATSA